MEESNDSRNEQGGDPSPLILPGPTDRVRTLIEKRKQELSGDKDSIAKEHDAKYRKKLDRAMDRFSKLFIERTKKYFPLTGSDIAVLDDRELAALENDVAVRARKDALSERLFVVGSPLGWFTYFCWWLGVDHHDPRPTSAWTYIYLRGRLQHACGKSWLPVERIQTEAKRNYW